MMKNIIIGVALMLALANFLVIGLKNPDPAELIFTNLTIKDSRYQSGLNSIAYANGKIIFIGNENTVHPLIGKDSQVIKLNPQSEFYLTNINDKNEINSMGIDINKLNIHPTIDIGSAHNAIIIEDGKIKYFISEGKIK